MLRQAQHDKKPVQHDKKPVQHDKKPVQHDKKPVQHDESRLSVTLGYAPLSERELSAMTLLRV